MFDGLLPEIPDLVSLTDAELVDAAGGWARAENMAAARKLAVMAELFDRRTGLPTAAERELWWIDPQAAVATEVAAAVNVSTGMALHQTNRGVALRDRLPRVAALFEAGLVSDLLVRTIVSRTYLIEDDAAMAAVDADLAERVTRWGALSVKKTEHAIDELVERHDPGAVRRTLAACAQETVVFGCPTDPAGITTIWARVNAADAAVMEANVEAMARSVCDADPRSMDQRRSHALAARTNGTAYGCRCGDPDCSGGVPGDAPARNAVVYAVADEHTLDAATNPPAEAAAEPERRESPPARPKPAYLFGAGIMPNALLGAVVERARIREVRHPGADSAPEPRYAPSRGLAEFVRCRDLTCRFPGCDKPAQVCDIDHTVAYPVGPTHPSNLKCLCRFHHLLKTFWTALGGWRDRQLPDGTIVWTSPTGHTYATYPGSRYLFPTLCEPTATLWTGEPPTVQTTGDRGVMMPKRRHTRAHNTAKAKATERKLNDNPHVAERNKPPPF